MDIAMAMDNDEWGEYSADCQPNNGMFGTEEYMEGAVHEYTRCYECGGYGHMAADCASKGKGKGGGKAGWNQKGKGKGKAGGKGAVKGGWTPPWGGQRRDTRMDTEKRQGTEGQRQGVPGDVLEVLASGAQGGGVPGPAGGG